MMELPIATRTVEDETGLSRIYHYSLVVDQVESGRFICEDYGVSITEDSGDCQTIPSITTSALRIDELITLLVENLVSPTSLPDIVADWL